MCEIKNTIRFSFCNGREKPTMGEIVNFVTALDADSGQIEAAYRIAEEKSLFVKFKSEESMLHALTFNSEDLIFHYANGKEAKVCMSHAGEYIQYVRVYDLPPEISDNEMKLVLGKYGKVKRVVREKFPVELAFDAYTGVRGVYMDVKTEIPTSLHFLNRKGNIFYAGNKDKCFLCKMDGHRMDSCPKRKTRKAQGKDEVKQCGSGTYAAVVSEARTEKKVLNNNVQEPNQDENEVEMVEAISTEEENEEQPKERDGVKSKPRFKYIRGQGLMETRLLTEEQLKAEEKKKLRARAKIFKIAPPKKN